MLVSEEKKKMWRRGMGLRIEAGRDIHQIMEMLVCCTYFTLFSSLLFSHFTPNYSSLSLFRFASPFSKMPFNYNPTYPIPED